VRTSVDVDGTTGEAVSAIHTECINKLAATNQVPRGDRKRGTLIVNLANAARDRNLRACQDDEKLFRPCDLNALGSLSTEERVEYFKQFNRSQLRGLVSSNCLDQGDRRVETLLAKLVELSGKAVVVPPKQAGRKRKFRADEATTYGELQGEEARQQFLRNFARKTIRRIAATNGISLPNARCTSVENEIAMVAKRTRLTIEE